MTLNKTELTNITPANIDSRGALRIPAGTQLIARRLTPYIHSCGINEISYYIGKHIKRAQIMFFDDEMYVVTHQVRFAETTIYQLSTPEFCSDGVCGEKYYALVHNGMTYFDESIDGLIKSAREDIWTRKINHIAHKFHAPKYAQDIVVHALNSTINARKNAPIDMKTRRHIEDVMSNLFAYFMGINVFCGKYRNNNALDELSYVTLEELGNIVLQIKSQNLGKTCTRLVKRRPDNDRHVHAMMVAGYKNPGCFPYQWLANTPVEQRGAVTDALHAAFGRAASDLYSPAYMAEPDFQPRFGPVLERLSHKITEITGVPAKIEYCFHGFFSKTYKITCDTQAYILKVYHSNIQYYTTKNCAHDIEAQNSFLVSGKKYCGRVRYRKVLTAGISNQRGMRYILYPYVAGPVGEVKHNPYDVFKTYHFCDNIGYGNMCGDTIIDIGMIQINECRIGRPYMTKIINTVLYRPWDDLAIVLKKYTPRQISECIEFMSQRIESNTPHRDTINAKLKFLTDKIRTR